MKKGFTLVELVIVIVIVGILSIVAVPIYRGYVEKARFTEGKMLVSAIKTAQDIYYAEHGAYYTMPANNIGYDPVLDIDARANKYFKTFRSYPVNADICHSASNDSINAGDYIDLYWKVPSAASNVYAEHELPFFRTYIDGEYTYQS